MCMVLWLVNSACMAGVHTPTKPVCVGGMLLVQWCYKHVLNCLNALMVWKTRAAQAPAGAEETRTSAPSDWWSAGR